jgi:hypothetical protein
MIRRYRQGYVCLAFLSGFATPLVHATDPVAEFWDEVNRSEVIFVAPSDGIESPEATAVRRERVFDEARDLALNRRFVEQKIYWVGGQWVRQGQVLGPAQSEGELMDSDQDGFDDFTEVKYHSDPMDHESTPAHYFEAKGKNRIVFFRTNATAHSR